MLAIDSIGWVKKEKKEKKELQPQITNQSRVLSIKQQQQQQVGPLCKIHRRLA
jgi:hypothetical protein